jgi:hypothetical protein
MNTHKPLRFGSALLIAVFLVVSCAQGPKTDATFEAQSDRSLRYTDSLVASKGSVFVAFGNRRVGNYPSEADRTTINYIEPLLRAKGFSIQDDKKSADYVFDLNTSDLFGYASKRLSRTYYASLAKQMKTPDEIIESLGYTRVGMWSAKGVVTFYKKGDLDSFDKAAIRYLIDLYPTQTEASVKPISELSH